MNNKKNLRIDLPSEFTIWILYITISIILHRSYRGRRIKNWKLASCCRWQKKRSNLHAQFRPGEKKKIFWFKFCCLFWFITFLLFL